MRVKGPRWKGPLQNGGVCLPFNRRGTIKKWKRRMISKKSTEGEQESKWAIITDHKKGEKALAEL